MYNRSTKSVPISTAEGKGKQKGRSINERKLGREPVNWEGSAVMLSLHNVVPLFVLR